jgi:hypothetical protein
MTNGGDFMARLNKEEVKHLEERLLEARVLIDKAMNKLKAGKATLEVGTPWSVEQAYTGCALYTYKVGQIVYTESKGHYNMSPTLLSEEYEFTINFPTKITEIEEKYVTIDGGFRRETKVVGQRYLKKE